LVLPKIYQQATSWVPYPLRFCFLQRVGLTFSCYQRRPLLAGVGARTIALQILKKVRDRYHFALLSYFIMPEHLHLLLSEAPGLKPEKIIKVSSKSLAALAWQKTRTKRPANADRDQSLLRMESRI
jgi:REP element-mobilizing transposase RayT